VVLEPLPMVPASGIVALAVGEYAAAAPASPPAVLLSPVLRRW
jgi:hypothetical protein